jgi:hypothetical protein
LPYDALVLVLSTPQSRQASTFVALRYLVVRPEHTPSFAGTPTLPPTSLPRPLTTMPTLLPYDALVSVLSTPQFRESSPFFTTWYMGVRCEHPPTFAGIRPFASWYRGVRYERTPSFAGTPALPPTSLPRPFDHRIHSLVPRSYQRGFGDLPHSLSGSATEAIATPRS